MLIRWKAAVVKEEGARGKHTQTHPHRPAVLHTRAAHLCSQGTRPLIFERISGKNAAESIMQNYTGTPIDCVTLIMRKKCMYMVKERE